MFKASILVVVVEGELGMLLWCSFFSRVSVLLTAPVCKLVWLGRKSSI